MTAAAIPPRAFAVRFKDLDRWDPSSFHRIFWHWPANVMRPLGSVLKVRKEKVDRKVLKFSDLQPITIHFDGTIDKREVDGNREYTMELFHARPRDIVVAKIDLKNGAVSIIPDGWPNAVVTGHFAVYEPDLSTLIPEYLRLLIQTRFFKAHLWRNKVGAEGRKEVKLDFFEAQPIPLPPLAVQRKIVAAWEAARKDTAATAAKIAQLERDIEDEFLDAIGIQVKESSPIQGAFVIPWSEFERWDLFYYRSDFLALEKCLDSVVTATLGAALRFVSRSWRRSDFPDGTFRYVEISNVTKSEGIVGARSVSVDNAPSRATTLIRAGDLIISTTRPYLGAFAIVPDEYDGCVCSSGFALCVGTRRDNLLPDFVLEFLKSPAGLKQMERRMTGGLYPAITQDELERVRIPVPPLSAQRQIAERVAKRRAGIATLKADAKARADAAKADVEAMILGTKPTA